MLISSIYCNDMASYNYNVLSLVMTIPWQLTQHHGNQHKMNKHAKRYTQTQGAEVVRGEDRMVFNVTHTVQDTHARTEGGEGRERGDIKMTEVMMYKKVSR